jgi:hypothetical protein
MGLTGRRRSFRKQAFGHSHKRQQLKQNIERKELCAQRCKVRVRFRQLVLRLQLGCRYGDANVLSEMLA